MRLLGFATLGNDISCYNKRCENYEGKMTPAEYNNVAMRTGRMWICTKCGQGIVQIFGQGQGDG